MQIPHDNSKPRILLVLQLQVAIYWLILLPVCIPTNCRNPIRFPLRNADACNKKICLRLTNFLRVQKLISPVKDFTATGGK